MLATGIVVALVQAGFACHAVRTGRSLRWIPVIVLLPVVGCVIYFLAEVFPGSRARRATRCLAKAQRRNESKRCAAGGRAARMKVMFVDPGMAYTVDTAYAAPLGGTQSAACYLAEALAAAGHDIVLATNTRSLGVVRGVTCVGWNAVPTLALREFRPDAVVMMAAAGEGQGLRQVFGERTRLILWTQHAHDQPAVKVLGSTVERDAYDGIALVSEWQKSQFVRNFGVDPARVRVLGNGASPAFCNLFAPGERIGAAKERPPVIAYTSTPFRGLDLLLRLFPEIRRRVPDTRLKVFSSMQVYQVSATRDAAKYGELYRRCRETDGVQYVGSLPQPRLARELRTVTAFAYPNTFAETYCIAALEAMAAGCRIVSSELGALPETTAGYAQLVPIGDRKDYDTAFVDALASALNESLRGEDEQLLSRQVAHVNAACTWEVRAREWIAWLSAIACSPIASTPARD